MLDKKVIRERLINDFDCKESQADGVVEKITKLAPDIYAAFEEWYKTGVIKEIEVEGYNVASLREKKKNMNVIGAYLTLDWLRREPQQAKRALNEPVFLNSVAGRKNIK